MSREQYTDSQIIAYLDDCLEVEFSFVHSEVPAEQIVLLDRERQDFVLSLVRRVAATNIELAFQLACNANRALSAMDEDMVEAWAMSATDDYDRKGLFPALSVIREPDSYIETAAERACGALFENEVNILLPFVHGLSGRKLSLQTDDESWTDTETIYLPPIMARMPDRRQNFVLYKAVVAHHWAQIHYGTFHADLDELARRQADDPAFLDRFQALETARLDACIRRELPGLYRDMNALNESVTPKHDHDEWNDLVGTLNENNATVQDTLQLVEHTSADIIPPPHCYQGVVRIEAVAGTMYKRIDREKARLRVSLSEIASEMLGAADEEQQADPPGEQDERPRFNLDRQYDDGDIYSHGDFELTLDDKPVPIPDNVSELLSSIFVDFGGIPPEHLVAAGPGEYDPSKYEDSRHNPEDVWQGAYHEEGAAIYNEWNFQRQHYHKDWCVLREQEVQPKYDRFVDETLDKHKGLLKSLRHTFEILRGEDRLLKRQPYGSDIDIDACVDALADVASGMEMPDALFTRMHREHRSVAVLFLVDMSASTRGWINEAERESLVLLAEVLEILGDRYAIYGFSGVTRKRCELFRIKSFDDCYDGEVRARISSIEPHAYTRMGVFIRHGTRLFSSIEATTRLMITLSDGKPDDYDTYRGEYGVEDTRQALYEARLEGIHSFCITIDEEARDYLPRMYGAANYAVIDDVRQLPLKVSDIYRRLTS